MSITLLKPDNPVVAWWRARVIASVDHVEVVEKVRDEAGFTGRYAFMTLMSAGIAVLGLLLSSPAVVIGAMLISPLMGPIIGLGFGLATFDWDEIRTACISLALGVVIAVLFTALLVLVSPIQNVTAEIAARTRPNLFDLLVALFSALAGAYAMIRGRAGTVVGVAIATALMPPIAVVGFGLATWNWTVFAGSLLLFLTNLITIAVAAAVVARLYGFGSHLSPQHTMLQTIVVTVTLSAFAIPLGLVLVQLGWEANASRQIREVIGAEFEGAARLSQVDIDYQRDPIRVSATVLTPRVRTDVDRRAAATLTQLIGRKVAIELEQIRVGTGAQAEAAQVAAAQASSASAANRVALRAQEQLALIAGVKPDAVLLDRDNRRAVVNAAPLPGANLAAYRALEARVATGVQGWSVTLVPPATALPDIAVVEDKPDADALATAIWAARRIKLPIGVSGADAEVVVDALSDAGVDARVTGNGNGAARLRWLAPEATE
ncbi:DUF389 domain-containing protein [Sphingomonas suaedae]|uniref:DUF389 domain-containing protein n=1 Tax=Sphingomonas suaedae TaxID=2599297 RepID=A0A518RIK4_9SPHN|nr:DUF389 domain-containing protein [Sphingomonas suaedae]QDX27264.1 DUF389 domain-containing protein [Sphingomonas suaedae]